MSTGPMCNQFQWIDENIVEALRLAQSANAGTPKAAEWKRLADNLQLLQDEHLERCITCRTTKVNMRRTA